MFLFNVKSESGHQLFTAVKDNWQYYSLFLRQNHWLQTFHICWITPSMDLFLDDYLSIIILIISIINTIILSYLLFISIQSSPARYNTSTSTTSLRKLRFNLPPLSRYESIQDTRIPDTRYSEIICPEPTARTSHHHLLHFNHRITHCMKFPGRLKQK